MEPRLHGRHGELERARRLLARHPLDVAQEQHLPVVDVERGQRAHEALQLLGRPEEALRIVAAPPGRYAQVEEGRLVAGRHLVAPGPQRAAGCVAGDGEQPVAHRAELGAVAGGAAVGGDERLLRHVGGQRVVARHRAGEPLHRPGVPRRQGVEGGALAARDQGEIVFVHGVLHSPHRPTRQEVAEGPCPRPSPRGAGRGRTVPGAGLQVCSPTIERDGPLGRRRWPFTPGRSARPRASTTALALTRRRMARS